MRALVRERPESYPDLYEPKGIDIDLELARHQHEEYIEDLRWLGYDIKTVPADETLPDCVFVEDPAIVHDGTALIVRMGTEWRIGEEDEVRSFFASTHDLIEMEPPATLEGGDVLVAEDCVYVGLSDRSNREALPYVERLFPERAVETIPVDHTWHLKTACSYLGDGTVLIAPGMIDTKRFSDLECVAVPEEEWFAANCIAEGDRVLVPAAAEKTIALLEDNGYTVRPVEVSEFRLGDGSLTCLSILY